MRYSGASNLYPSGRIDVALSARRVEVDNRISLRLYYRIADNVMKQADIFREEKNIIDLYIMLLRFSSLVSETIPCHSDYKASAQSKKNYLKKRLINALNELEELKPAFERENSKFERKDSNQVNGLLQSSSAYILEQPFKKSINHAAYEREMFLGKCSASPVHEEFSRSSAIEPMKENFYKMSLSFSCPKEETLSRHSILGRNGLNGQWQPPKVQNYVRYPNNIDLSPVQLQSPQHTVEGTIHHDNNDFTEAEPCSEVNRTDVQPEVEEISNSALTLNTDDKNLPLLEPPSMISFESELPVQFEPVRQPSPPPVIAEVHDLIPVLPSHVTETRTGLDASTLYDVDRSENPLELHISSKLMDIFMKLAKSNTDKNLETCGILAGSLKNRNFYITTLIIPKQESTSDTCHTTNEEEIFEVQDDRSLFPLGWIHTHPTQSCFMSSVDLHTHYSYQTMMPEAVAIVMAPRDCSKKHGIFRLTNPGGMSVIRRCQRRGFHHHDQPLDGKPIYGGCSHVYFNPSLHFDVIDLR